MPKDNILLNEDDLAITRGQLARTLENLTQVYFQPLPDSMIVQQKFGSLIIATIIVPGPIMTQAAKMWGQYLKQQEDIQRVAEQALRTKH